MGFCVFSSHSRDLVVPVLPLRLPRLHQHPRAGTTTACLQVLQETFCNLYSIQQACEVYSDSAAPMQKSKVSGDANENRSRNLGDQVYKRSRLLTQWKQW